MRLRTRRSPFDDDATDKRGGPPSGRGRRVRRPAWTRGRAGRRTAAAGLAGVLLVLGLLRLDVDTGVTSFLPTGADSAEELEALQRSFGGDPIVVLLTGPEDGALLASERLPELLRVEGELAALDDVAVVYGPATAINQVAGQAQQLLATISGRRDGLRDRARREALARGASAAQAEQAAVEATKAFDQRYGSLLAGGLDAGLPTLRNAAFVRSVAYAQDGRPRPQYRFLLPSPRSVSVLVRPREDLDQLDTDALARAVRARVTAADLGAVEVQVTGAPVLSAALAQTVRRELPLLGAAAVVLVGGVLLVMGRGRLRRRLVPLAAAAVATAVTLAVLGLLGLPLSLGMLALMPILIGIGNNYPVYLSEPARRRTVATVAVASAGAFATLLLAPLPFVRGLGLSLAVGVLASFAVAVLTRGDAAPASEPLAPDARPGLDDVRAPQPGGRRRAAALLAVGALVAAAGWWQLPGLPVQASPESTARGLPAVEEAERAEQVLGSTGEVSVVLRGPDVLRPEALAWSRLAEEAVVVELGDQLRVLASPQTLLGFLGPEPTPQQVLAAADIVPRYLLGAVVRSDRRASVVTLGVRIGDLGALQQLLDDVRAVLPPPPDGFDVQVAGLPVVAVDGFAALGRDRLLPNAAALLVLALVVAIGLRSVREALWALLAATLAAGWGFAAVAASGIAVSPLLVALGALVAAVGCEFTILGREARTAASPRVGRAVATAAATGIAGFAALLLSELRIIQEFGVALIASLVLAYLSARLVVALSAGPHAASAAFGRADATAPEPEMVHP